MVNSTIVKTGGSDNNKNLRNRLLVEGPDDAGVCYHLFQCYHLKSPEQIEVINKNGIENLRQSLRAELSGSQLENLGIVVDADENLSKRWQSLRDKLIELGYNSFPSNPEPQGTIIRENDKAIGIWLMPDNKLPGMLEDFCSFLIPTNDTLWPLAENTLQQVVAQDRRFQESFYIKARLHTWLAWQQEPGKPMGQAITKRFFDHKAPHAQQFIHWLHQLFSITL